MADRDREPTPQEALEQARKDVRGTERYFWALETGMMAWDEGTEEAEEQAYQLAKARMYAAQARLASAEAAVQPEQVTVPEAAQEMGTSMDELAAAQEIVEAEDAAQAEPYAPEGVDAILARMEAERTPAEAEADRAAVVARRRREHQEALAVQGIATEAPAPESAEQAEVVMFDLASVPEIIEAGNAEDAGQVERERQERFEAKLAAKLAEMEAARAARAAQLAAFYGPQPEMMPGTEPGPGFEREM